MRSVRHRVAGAGEAIVLWVQNRRPLRGVLAGHLQFRARLQLAHILEHVGKYWPLLSKLPRRLDALPPLQHCLRSLHARGNSPIVAFSCSQSSWFVSQQSRNKLCVSSAARCSHHAQRIPGTLNTANMLRRVVALALLAASVEVEPAP